MRFSVVIWQKSGRQSRRDLIESRTERQFQVMFSPEQRKKPAAELALLPTSPYRGTAEETLHLHPVTDTRIPCRTQRSGTARCRCSPAM